MLDLNDVERDYLIETRALSVNVDGEEVLVGLSVDETVFMPDHMKRFIMAERDHDRERKKRFLELRSNHELARFAVLAAEIEKRNDNPTEH